MRPQENPGRAHEAQGGTARHGEEPRRTGRTGGREGEEGKGRGATPRRPAVTAQGKVLDLRCSKSSSDWTRADLKAASEKIAKRH